VQLEKIKKISDQFEDYFKFLLKLKPMKNKNGLA